MDEPITPRELARDLDVSGKRIRDYLRSRYGKLAERQLTRWELTDAEASDVRTHFRDET